MDRPAMGWKQSCTTMNAYQPLPNATSMVQSSVEGNNAVRKKFHCNVDGKKRCQFHIFCRFKLAKDPSIAREAIPKGHDEELDRESIVVKFDRERNFSLSGSLDSRSRDSTGSAESPAIVSDDWNNGVISSHFGLQSVLVCYDHDYVHLLLWISST